MILIYENKTAFHICRKLQLLSWLGSQAHLSSLIHVTGNFSLPLKVN